MNNLSALPYYGGKSANAHGYGTGRWINSLLPTERDVLYCEPCYGFGGVHLPRPPSKLELVNDINDRIANWWWTVQDEREELGRLVETTPFSRRFYEWGLENLDNPSLPNVKRAQALFIVLIQSLMHADGNSHGGWACIWNPKLGMHRFWTADDICRLNRRMRKVQVECKDASEILERTAGVEQSIIYFDPPYPSIKNSSYRFSDVDVGGVTELLLVQKGKVAVSGYGDEWDHLGWRRVERRTTRFNVVHGVDARTEVLWMNYEAGQLSLEGVQTH